MVRPLCLILLLAAVGGAQAPDRGVARVTAAYSGHRSALVIGNRAYARGPLGNSVNDAQDLGALLNNQLGFQTTVKTDLNQEAFERSVEDFLGQVQPGDTALFYYAGHGTQIEGENLLLPTDFSATDDIAAKYRAYHVNQLRDRLRGRGARITIIVLDACRDNPFRTWRSESGGGLAGMGGAGAFIAFAADEGKTAQDNPGERNGLFTKHLLTELREPGLTISEVFDRVRENVYRESSGRQTPFAYSGLIGTFRFREMNAASAPAINLDIERYNAVKDSRDPAQLEAVAGEISRADLAGILREKARSLRSLAAPSPAAAAAVAPKVSAEDLSKRAKDAYDHKDWATAFPLVKLLAENGDRGSELRLGAMYSNGFGVSRDDAQAVLWYQKAAAAGESAAAFNMGVRYQFGRGVPQDDAQAVSWYRKAADAGIAPAMTNLGFMYFNGRGLPQDDAQALAWYRKGADAGDALGMRNLAYMYENGRGTKADRSQATEWYRKAAQAGDDPAKAALKKLGVEP